MLKTTKVIASRLLLACGFLLAQQAQAHGAPHDPIVQPQFSKALADMPGKEVLVLTVEYPPGGTEPIHRHDAHAVVFVLEGEIVMAVKGGQTVTLRPGDTFYEGPIDVHTVGRNASKTQRARFVVMMVKNTGVDAVLPVN